MNKIHDMINELAFVPGLDEFGGRTTTDDPLKVFKFRVEAEGFVRVGCTEVQGFNEVEAEVSEYREGGDNATSRKSAGLVTFPALVLRRGRLVGSTRGGDDDFALWFKTVYEQNAGGAPSEYRRTLDIVLLRRDNTEAVRLRYFECWPSKFKGSSDLDAKTSDDSIEEITIENEGWVAITTS